MKIHKNICKADLWSECFAANKPGIWCTESQSAVTRIGEKRSWKLKKLRVKKLKVENDLVSDVLKEDIAALDEDLKVLEDIRSYQ